jgi:hypothetical protein
MPVRPMAAALVPVTPFPAIDFVAMAHRQCQFQSVQLAKASTSLQLQLVDVQGTRLLCDVAHGATRPVVPLHDQRGGFQAVHGVAHPGIRATRRLVSARFVWHGLARDVGNWCRDCQTCQHGKVTKQLAAPLQFTSSTWADLCSQLGMRHILTMAYHPQSNGMVERVHRQIKAALCAHEAGPACHGHLPWALLGIRATPKEVSGVSSAEMVFGQPLHLPGEFLQPPEESATSGKPPAPSYAMVADIPPPHLVLAQYVYVRRGKAPGTSLCRTL